MDFSVKYQFLRPTGISPVQDENHDATEVNEVTEDIEMSDEKYDVTVQNLECTYEINDEIEVVTKKQERSAMW